MLNALNNHNFNATAIIKTNEFKTIILKVESSLSYNTAAKKKSQMNSCGYKLYYRKENICRGKIEIIASIFK